LINTHVYRLTKGIPLSMLHKFSSISVTSLGFLLRLCTERLWVVSDKAFSFVWHISWTFLCCTNLQWFRFISLCCAGLANPHV